MRMSQTWFFTLRAKITRFFAATHVAWFPAEVVTTYNTHHQGLNMPWEPRIYQLVVMGFRG